MDRFEKGLAGMAVGIFYSTAVLQIAPGTIIYSAFSDLPFDILTAIKVLFIFGLLVSVISPAYYWLPRINRKKPLYDWRDFETGNEDENASPD